MLLVVLLPGIAAAQDSSASSSASSAEASAAKASKRTEFSFEEDTIEGDLSRPDGEYVEALKRVPHSNLIRIRDEFKDKVMQSVDEL
ncbi:MAG TPA: adventurous gliding motility protein CglF [Myxococcaceae bacterium]|nr:adventurous gliding motility protein CglF [Myxococcaceae bacterium]